MLLGLDGGSSGDFHMQYILLRLGPYYALQIDWWELWYSLYWTPMLAVESTLLEHNMECYNACDIIYRQIRDEYSVRWLY